MNSFSIQHLQSLTSPQEMGEYVESTLQRLGSGATRDVFALGADKVLKFAFDEESRAQNKVEARIGKIPRFHSYLLLRC